MTANNRNLTDLLVQKTGLEEEQVNTQLDLLADHIQAALKEKGTFKIPDLGKFVLKDSSVDFIAEEQFATEINHNYAGMKPIELIGAFQEIYDSSAEEEPASGLAAGVEEYEKEVTPEKEKEDQQEEKIIAGKIPIPDEGQESPEKVPEVPKEIVAAENRAPDEDENEEVKPEVKQEKVKARPVAPSGTDKKEYRQQSDREAQDPIGRFLIAAVIVIALGISGWLVYDMGFFENESNNNNNNNAISESRVTQNPNLLENGSAGSDNNKAEHDSVVNSDNPEAGTSEQNESKPGSSITSIAEESRQSAYGLRGGATPDISDGYTIVILSMRNEARVRRVNTELQQEGYRTIITKASVMDTTFWRLGLGRFKTINDASEASLKLPDPYKSNYFIKRIQ